MPNQWARFTQLQSRDFSMSQLEHNPQDYNPINYHTTPLGAISLAINDNTRGTISEAYSGGGLLGLSPPPSWTRWFLCPNGCWQPPSKEIKFKPPLDKFLNTPLHNLHLLCLEQGHDYSLSNQYGVSTPTSVFELYMLQDKVIRRNYNSYVVLTGLNRSTFAILGFC